VRAAAARCCSSPASCPICKTLLPTVRRAVAGEDRVRLVCASDGESAEHAAFAREQGLDPASYVVSRELGVRYEVAKLPYAVLIDAAGIVRAKGIVNTREHVESLFEAERLGVPTIQARARRGDHPTGEDPPDRLDARIERAVRALARRTGRRAFLARLGALLVGALGLPLLPVARSAAESPRAPGPDENIPGKEGDPTHCDYWRHCAMDGFACACCGAPPPPARSQSPVGWVGSCHNPADGKDYIISYNDCCGKDGAGAAAAAATRERPTTGSATTTSTGASAKSLVTTARWRSWSGTPSRRPER
jgi:amicyanin-dependent methylamine dehydrogenase small subunit